MWAKSFRRRSNGAFETAALSGSVRSGEDHNMEGTSTDSEVEAAVIKVLVSAKQPLDGVTDIEYVAGRRCDVQRRLEGRQ